MRTGSGGGGTSSTSSKIFQTATAGGLAAGTAQIGTQSCTVGSASIQGAFVSGFNCVLGTWFTIIANVMTILFLAPFEYVVRPFLQIFRMVFNAVGLGAAADIGALLGGGADAISATWQAHADAVGQLGVAAPIATTLVILVVLGMIFWAIWLWFTEGVNLTPKFVERILSNQDNGDNSG